MQDTLTERVDRLERSMRRWRRSALVAAVAAIAAIAVAAGEKAPRDLRSERFTLVNRAGAEVAGLFADAQGSALVLKNGAGKLVFSLSAADNGAALTLLSTDETPLVVMQSNANGGVLGLHNTQGKMVVGAAPNKEGVGAMVLSDADGDDKIAQVAFKTGGVILVNGENGKRSAAVFSKDNRGRVEAYDPTGKPAGGAGRGE